MRELCICGGSKTRFPCFCFCWHDISYRLCYCYLVQVLRFWIRLKPTQNPADNWGSVVSQSIGCKNSEAWRWDEIPQQVVNRKITKVLRIFVFALHGTYIFSLRNQGSPSLFYAFVKLPLGFEDFKSYAMKWITNYKIRCSRRRHFTFLRFYFCFKSFKRNFNSFHTHELATLVIIKEKNPRHC